MSGNLVRDTKTQPIQGFAPTRIVAVSSGVEWKPGVDDRAFCVSADTDYQINATGTAGTLKAGAVRVIGDGQTYEFTVSQNIEVM